MQAPELGPNIGYKEKERGVRAALFFYIWKRIRYLGRNKGVRGLDKNFPQAGCRGEKSSSKPCRTWRSLKTGERPVCPLVCALI
jgi:hypothetical protein